MSGDAVTPKFLKDQMKACLQQPERMVVELTTDVKGNDWVLRMWTEDRCIEVPWSAVTVDIRIA